MFLYHQKNLEDITRETMRGLVSHKYKLTKLIDFEYQREINLAELDGIRLSSDNLKQHLKELKHLRSYFSTLNFIKQLAMYYDFRIDRTLTLSNQIKFDKKNTCNY